MKTENDPHALLSILREPHTAVRYAASVHAAAVRAGKAVVETEDRLFDPMDHADAGHAMLRVSDASHAQWGHAFEEPGLPAGRALRNGWMTVDWKGHTLEVLRVGYDTFGGRQVHQIIVADEREVAARYFAEVCTHCSEVRDEVLVYANGCWNKSKELFEQVRSASFADLVLAEGLAERIRDDFDRFLAAREQYARWNVPWKRGALFLGPPGNGKTLCIKALIAHLGLPCLYVQSFEAPRMPPQVAIREVFSRARRTSPCVMVLEDLDSLVRPEARSFFLNELDGFSSNTGLVTIGSTNHPERLDPAIVDRPSRFDRKYHFGLPGPSERFRYAQLWNAKLASDLRLSDADLEALAGSTEAFSFAYLKELFASTLMRFASDPGPGLAAIARDEAAALRAQMETVDLVADPSPVIATEDDPWAVWSRRRARSRT